MKAIKSGEIKEIAQSGHLNFLLGAGCSHPYLPLLTDIETAMTVEATKERAQKDYYAAIKKSKAVLNGALESDATEGANLTSVKTNYNQFVQSLGYLLAKRKLQIVNKQANVFTTNFDMFLEDACENLGVPYNDGFSSQIRRKFSVSNFNKIQKYKSLQFDNTSDIPLLNIIKLHGSISWKQDDGNTTLLYSDGSHIPDDLETLSGADFESAYKKIAVINPNAEKHFETVLDTNYAAMLRKFTLELEKENSVLIIMGFSLNDKHIKELLYGVMKSNPTLVVIFFSHSTYDDVIDRHNEKQYSNLYIISPESGTRPFDESSKYFFEMLKLEKPDGDYERKI